MCYAEDSNVSVGEAEKCLRDILTYYYGEEGEVITDKLTRIAQEVCPRVITWEDAQ